MRCCPRQRPARQLAQRSPCTAVVSLRPRPRRRRRTGYENARMIDETANWRFSNALFQPRIAYAAMSAPCKFDRACRRPVRVALCPARELRLTAGTLGLLLCPPERARVRRRRSAAGAVDGSRARYEPHARDALPLRSPLRSQASARPAWLPPASSATPALAQTVTSCTPKARALPRRSTSSGFERPPPPTGRAIDAIAQHPMGMSPFHSACRGAAAWAAPSPLTGV